MLNRNLFALTSIVIYYIVFTYCNNGLYVQTKFASKDMLEVAKNECNVSHPTNSSIIEYFSEKYELPPGSDEKNSKCYIKCMLVKSHTMNDEGVIDIESVKECLYGHDLATQEAVIKDCTKFSETDTCEIAYKYLTCLGSTVKREKESKKT